MKAKVFFGLTDPEASLTIRPMVGDEYAKYLRSLQGRCKSLAEAARKAR